MVSLNIDDSIYQVFLPNFKLIICPHRVNITGQDDLPKSPQWDERALQFESHVGCISRCTNWFVWLGSVVLFMSVKAAWHRYQEAGIQVKRTMTGSLRASGNRSLRLYALGYVGRVWTSVPAPWLTLKKAMCNPCTVGEETWIVVRQIMTASLRYCICSRPLQHPTIGGSDEIAVVEKLPCSSILTFFFSPCSRW